MEEIDFIEKNYQLEGDQPRKIVGMDRAGLYQLFAKLGYKIGCEVGLERGRNGLIMFENIPGLKLYGVDSYKEHPQASYIVDARKRNWDEHYLAKMKRRALELLEGKDLVIVEKFSEDAVKDIPDNFLDFVYIDSDHSYDFIMQDIIIWGRKIRKGGILSGHDYYNDKKSSHRRTKVVQAIDDYTKVHGIKFFITGEDHRKESGDVYPSWFWVKEDDVWPNVIV